MDMNEMRALMASLAKRRPIFHGEADFQHALAWELHLRHPSGELRLEQHVAPGVHLDLGLREANRATAFELKYLTRSLDVRVAGEGFLLRQHGAQPPRRYDCVRDLVRLEKLIALGAADEGFAIVLTNDPGYWKEGRGDGGVGAAFRIHQGSRIGGTLSWGANTAAGTMYQREAALSLAGDYMADWTDYGADSAGHQLRYLAVEVRRDKGPGGRA